MVAARAIDRTHLHCQNHLHRTNVGVSQSPATLTYCQVQLVHRGNAVENSVVESDVELVSRLRGEVRSNVGARDLHLGHGSSNERASPEAPVLPEEVRTRAGELNPASA